MDLDIQDSLQELFCNIGIKIEYVDLRQYKVLLVIDASEYNFLYKWDANLTFDGNIDIIRKEIEKCIIKYYKR